MTHGLSEAEWERGDHKYHQRKDDAPDPQGALSRFYIIQEARGGVDVRDGAWRVVSGPYISRSHAETFLPNYEVKSNDPGLAMEPKVVSRLWLAKRAYPSTQRGEERLQKVLDIRRELECR